MNTKSADNVYPSYLVDDIGWINNDEFCVWLSYSNFKDFVDGLKHVFGSSLFDYGIKVVIIEENILCITLSDYISISELEDIFPKATYQH